MRRSLRGRWCWPGPAPPAALIDEHSPDGGAFDEAAIVRRIDHDFDETNHIYLSYSAPTERGAAVAIDRAELIEEDGAYSLASVETIFMMQEEDQDSSGLHFGGRMAIHPEDGSIFLTIGDRRNISRSQDFEDQAGSVLRIMPDGSVPEDNPFVGEADVNDYIYATGIRNSQGLAFNPQTGELWSSEHGPEGGDEINLIEAGSNYGWPFITGGVDYSGAPIGVGLEAAGMTSPVHVFEDTVAPSGIAFVEGEMFEAWQGDMLVSGLMTEGIVRLSLDGASVVGEEVIEIGRRIRDVEIATDGAVWVLTEHEDSEIVRLVPCGIEVGALQ